MKKKNLIPLAFSSIFLTLSGCGGENASIYEDPNSGVKTSTNGCRASDSGCQGFVLDYPVSGLNFDCSSKKIDHFSTMLEGNVVAGGCPVGDKVTFYIQGETTARKVSLGTVDLQKMVPSKSKGQYAYISVADLAEGLTGKQINLESGNDTTYQTMLALVKIFQAIGLKQQSNELGDVQYIHLSNSFKDDLQILKANIEAGDYSDGSYVQALRAWIDVSQVSNAQADEVARQLLNLRHVGVFSAEFLPILALNADVQGFYGKSLGGNTSIGSLFMLSTRQGYNIGYALQWRGVPKQEGNQSNSPLSRIVLINQVVPTKLNVESNSQNWLHPVTNRVVNPLRLKTAANGTDSMEIYKGRLLSQSTLPGNEFMYKLNAEQNATPNSNDYTEWRQDINGERYTGTIDILKTNPAVNLDRQVFKTLKNTKSGDFYLFPMYVDLTFKYDNTDVAAQTVSVVIDEQGDIRTNRSATSLQSGKCLGVNNNLVDGEGVQQYRIGTLAASNNTANDKSLTLRMIFANPVFGHLDGALVGLNRDISVDPQSVVNSGVVYLNISRLVLNKDLTRGITIAGFNNGANVPARWLNMHALYQEVYNANDQNTVTQEQRDLAKRLSGSIEATLSPCYQIKEK